ncbi:hypothetical protein B0H14DRAFT_2748090 [Mycena olivaceomarginata]|nr:hypothetical protein B0H14DRAFT_2748090 [Mycena olivaceomarginata]
MADVAWAYNALEQLDRSQPTDPAVIGDLLQVPLHYGHILARPTPAVFRAIIWAISCDSRRTNQLACHHLLLPSAHHCFDDNELRPLLQQNSTWTSLALVLVQAPVLYPPDFMFPMTAQYIALGDKISQTPDWNPVITQDLPGWLSTLTALLGGDPEGEPRRSFCRVLSRLWDAGESESEQFGDEKALVMSFTALANAWDRFDFSNSQTIQPLMRLIECTVSTAFCARLVDEFRDTVNNPSPCFKDIVMPRLGDAVGRAVQMLNAAVNPDLNDVANRAAENLSKLASTINGELKSRPPADESTDSRMEVGYWKRLQTEFEQDIKALPGFVQKTSLTVEVPDI